MPELEQLLADVVDIESFPATGTALDTSPALLTADADTALVGLLTKARDEGDHDREAFIRQFRAFLLRCRRDGLEEVFPPNHPDIDPKVVLAIAADMNAADEAEADYDSTGATEALTTSAAAWRRVLDDGSLVSAYPGLRAAVSNNAGQLLLRRYWAVGAKVDLEDALDALRAAVALTSRRSSLRAGRLSNLGLATREEYRQSGDVGTLDRAVEAFADAVQAARSPSALTTALTNLALGLQDRYLHTSDPHDLEQAFGCAQRAYDSTQSVGAAVMLADLLRRRFVSTGERDDLTAAVALLRDAVRATSLTAPERPRRLVDLGIALLDQHAESGDSDDLTTAISLFDDAVATIPPTSPDWPAAMVHRALAHLRSYESRGALDDLNRAVEGLRVATEHSGTTGVDSAAWTANYAAALHQRARRVGASEDLNSAIALFETLVASPSGFVDRFAVVNNLGNALRDRYGSSEDGRDLDRAIDVLRGALGLAPAGSAHSATLLANLGAAYRDRFAANGLAEDLAEAVSRLRAAAELTGLADLDRPRRLFTFALAARSRYDLTGDPTDLASADGAFRDGCALGVAADPLETLAAGQEWGAWAAAHERWPDAAVSFGSAIDALVAVVRVQLTWEHKETWLRDATTLPARAAYANVKVDRPRKAVLALEVGRATIHTDALERDRIDLRVVAAGRPVLVERFEQAANRLRQADRRRRSATY